jgi:hypothetical protein
MAMPQGIAPEGSWYAIQLALLTVGVTTPGPHVAIPVLIEAEELMPAPKSLHEEITACVELITVTLIPLAAGG